MSKEAIPQVLASMAEGLSLRKACELHGVVRPTFLLWCEQDSELADQYARARTAMLDAQAEALEDIGDEAASASSAVAVAGLRLKSDNRKWLLSKLAPKKYGERIDVGNADGEAFKIDAVEWRVVHPTS